MNRKRSISVPPPDPLAPLWTDRYTREVSQEDAARLTHYRRATVRTWARDPAAIPPLALAQLQAHLWGCIVPREFRTRGVRFEGEKLVTRNGYALDVHELEALCWTLAHYREALHPAPPPPPKPRRLGWRQWLARHRAGLPTP